MPASPTARSRDEQAGKQAGVRRPEAHLLATPEDEAVAGRSDAAALPRVALVQVSEVDQRLAPATALILL